MGTSCALYENLILNDMKKNTNYTAPIIKSVSIESSVICTSFNNIVTLTENLDTDSLDW